MRFLKLTIAYDGTNYVGWQVQPNGISIQYVLESVWTSVTKEQLRITASGRTDSGVHARGQVCSLSTASQIPAEHLVRALNANLPFDIRVLDINEAPVNFHAIRDSIDKTYRFQIQTGNVMDVFQQRFRWFVPRTLDVAAMTRAATYIVGKHDFSSFEATGASREDSIRTVTDLTVTSIKPERFELVDIEVTADGFLYNMVRNIVGTLVVVGRGKKDADWVRQVIDSRNRDQAGETAPALGLFLETVRYGPPPSLKPASQNNS